MRILNPALAFITLALSLPPAQAQTIEVKTVSSESRFQSDDGSFIRNMSSSGNVQTVHCSLPKGGVIKASRHKTVSQIWYVLAGQGEIWLKPSTGAERIEALAAGTAITVPLGVSFQFRNTGDADLEIFIVNTSPWSGAGELIPVKDHWAPHLVKP